MVSRNDHHLLLYRYEREERRHAMKINKYHGKYNIQKRSMAVKYIVVHYTGSGTSKAGSALANCKYFASGDKQASAHYFIDDSGIWEYADPKEYFTWHCGDGHGKYGISNANSIGVEVCMNGDKPFTDKEVAYLKELIPYLMKKFGVPATSVVRHYDASRKMCPYYYAKRPAEWESLRKKITGTNTVPVKKGYGGTFPSLGSKGYLSYGDKGSNVSRLQQFLNWYGSYGLAVDGSFGPATLAAVKKYQKSAGLTVDGYFGPASLKKAKSIKR